MRSLALGLCALYSLSACNHGNSGSDGGGATTAAHDASTARDSARAAATTPLPNVAPETTVAVLRGATIRRALPLLVPGGGGVDQVIEQAVPQLTPGAAGHGQDIDADSPFAAVGLLGGADGTTVNFYVSWPLKPGMRVAQDARALRGWRLVSEGVYEPTTPDAGAGGEHQCWVAQRAPVGWMFLCGPTEGLHDVAGYLREQANTPVENAPILDVDLRVTQLRRVLNRQLGELDRNAPPRADAGLPALQRTAFEDARRSAALLVALANDVETFHGVVTQDENAMHLHAEAVMPRESSASTRALAAAMQGRQASRALLDALPATVGGWLLGGFDPAQITTAMGAPSVDPNVIAQAGPEIARVMSAVAQVRGPLPFGERVDAWSNDDGYTTYHVARRTDAVQYVNDLRVAINSLPATQLPGGGSLRDLAVIMPTPGLTGTQYLRIGRNVRVPPGMQLPPEIRAAIERSMLLVAEPERLIAVASHDPVARYRAMSQGPRLTDSVPANAVFAARLSPPSFVPLFYGQPIPGIPESRNTDAMSVGFVVTQQGEGVRAVLQADAPIGAALELRTIYAMVGQVEQQMAQQAAQQQAGGGAGRGPMRQPTVQRGPQGGAPELDPSALPEPPRMQLQPPR